MENLLIFTHGLIILSLIKLFPLIFIFLIILRIILASTKQLLKI